MRAPIDRLILTRANRFTWWLKLHISIAEGQKGRERTLALWRLDKLMQRVSDEYAETRSKLGNRLRKADDREIARTLHRQNLPVVKRVKDLFAPHVAKLMRGKLPQKMIDDLLSEEPKAGEVAKALGIEWNAETLIDLCGTKPSDWIVEWIADEMGCSPWTVKALVYARRK